jgi:hypothetical protein
MQRRGAWGDTHRAAGTHRVNDTSRKRNHTVLRRAGGVRAWGHTNTNQRVKFGALNFLFRHVY